METIMCECACSEFTTIPLWDELAPIYETLVTGCNMLTLCVLGLGLCVGLLAGFIWWRLCHV